MVRTIGSARSCKYAHHIAMDYLETMQIYLGSHGLARNGYLAY